MEYEEHLRNTLEKVNIKLRMCMILVFGEYIWYLEYIFGINLWYLEYLVGDITFVIFNMIYKQWVPKRPLLIPT